jgi:hypothetical protein
MSKYKALRPEDRWQKEQDKSNQATTEKKKRERSSKSKKPQTSNQLVATSEAYIQSDAPGPSYFQSDAPAPPNQGSPHETHKDPQTQEANVVIEVQQTESYQGRRASSARPTKRLKSVTSKAASAALRRAIQSSPARWLGTQHSPIELEEDYGSTRRLLFPSPRKDDTYDVLNEVATNTIQSAVSFHSPHTRSKDQVIETVDKENHPPLSLFGEEDDDIVKLFEEELARPPRPATPVQKSPANNIFKTPTRQTSTHRPVTRSISRSAQSSHKLQMLPQRTPTKTPSTGRRRSPRHNNMMESPFTVTLNKLLSEVNDNDEAKNHSPSRHLDFGLDFSALPDLGHSGTNDMHIDALNFQMPGFDPNHDFFSTDVPMPSSPPKLFSLYEDPLAMGMDGVENSMWSDFAMDDSAIQAMGMCDGNTTSVFNAGPTATEEASLMKNVAKDSGSEAAEQES